MGFWINLGTWGIPFYSLSHVAIVAKNPETGTCVLFESTSLCEQRCVVREKHVEGVQGHYVSLRSRLYKGKVYHYPLAKNLTDKQSGCLTDFCIGHLGVGYDAIGAFRSRDTPWGLLEQRFRPENLQALFCSEFCAAALREIEEFRTGSVSKWNPNSFARALHRRGIVDRPQRVK